MLNRSRTMSAETCSTLSDGEFVFGPLPPMKRFSFRLREDMLECLKQAAEAKGKGK